MDAGSSSSSTSRPGESVDGCATFQRILPLGVLSFLDPKSVAALEPTCKTIRQMQTTLLPACCSSLTVSRGRRVGDDSSLVAFKKYGSSLQTLQVSMHMRMLAHAQDGFQLYWTGHAWTRG